MEQGSFWSQTLTAAREYHETRWKGTGESKKQAIAAFESETRGSGPVLGPLAYSRENCPRSLLANTSPSTFYKNLT